MMVAAVTAQAQNDDLKNEIGVYYGLGSTSNIVGSIGEGIFKGGDQSGFWGPIGVEYYRHVTPLMAVGAQASIAGCKWKNTGGGTDDKTTFIAVMPSVKFNWLRKAHFGMYSGLSAGVLILSQKVDKQNAGKAGTDSQTDAKFIFNVTGIGMEFGGEAFRGFGELGMGEKGILCLGVRYKF